MNLDKWQAQYTFWASFGIPAYEENSVPDQKEVTYPYITYEAVGAPAVSDTFVNVSVWTRAKSPKQAMLKAKNILKRFEDGAAEIRYDNSGYFMTPESNFIQIMGDESDLSIKRAVLSLVIHW